ncbi:MAG: ATP-binding protein [Thermodesulfobacteriota bacterium]
MLTRLLKNSAYSSKTIVRDLLLWLTLLVFITTLIGATGYFFYSKQKMAEEINLRADLLVKELSSLISVPMFHMDSEGVAYISGIYSQTPDIVMICVEDEDGKKILESDCRDLEGFSRTVPVMREEQFLGRLSLVLSSDHHRQHRNSTLAVIIFMGLAMVAGLLVGIHVVMHFILGRPMQHFNRDLSKIAGGDYSTRMHGVVHTDLNRSVQAVNSMAEQIERVINKQRETAEFLENVLNSMPSIMIGVDGECRITHMNLSAQRSADKEEGECYGRALLDIFPSLGEKIVNISRQAMVEGIPSTVEKRNSPIFPEENNGHVELTIFPLYQSATGGAVIRIDDITAKVRLQEVMVQTEKMISVGGLGAGMAHEINNPLAGMLQATQNIERRLSPELTKNKEIAKQWGVDLVAMDNYLDDRQIFSMLTSIRNAGQQAAGIVQNMLKFSNHTGCSTLKESCSLGDLVDRALELAASDYDLKRKYDFKNVEVTRNYDPDVEVDCNSIEIEQVLLSIFTNTVHAFGGGNVPAPKITINIYEDEAFATIEVIDNGPGIEEEVKKRIFEPFFTTKAEGEGTGLGLAVAYYIIVDQHKGCLSVDSSPGQGTRFSLKLPGKNSDASC